MPKKLALDWDDDELRIVAAQCNGSSVKVTNAEVIAIGGGNLVDILRNALTRHGLEKVDGLVALGRSKAELRDLQLPPVPDDELPDMVRFQATRSFASAGENAILDYLITNRSDRGVEMIAAAIAPAKLESIRQICSDVNLAVSRITLRPLDAAALYLTRAKDVSAQGDTVLIDLLAGDAEIVVARGKQVVFVRTVKLPSSPESRPSVLAGELRRSLVAAGSTGTLAKVILWGRESVHHAEVEKIAEATGSEVSTLDPFSLVEVEPSASGSLPLHSGRLAPLIGLLVADQSAPERLIDFLNPRKRIEIPPNHAKTALLIGAPIAAMLLLGYLVYKQLGSLDSQIASLKTEIAGLEPQVKTARVSIDRTEKVDVYLDGDVNWLAEMKRLAEVMPPSDKLILKAMNGSVDQRKGGGRLTLSGAVTDPAIIEQFESAMRDGAHEVVGDGTSEQRSEDAYRWTFSETVSVSAESVRNARYEGLAPKDETSTDAASETANVAAVPVAADAPAEETPSRDVPLETEKSAEELQAEPQVEPVPVPETSTPTQEAPTPEAVTETQA